MAKIYMAKLYNKESKDKINKEIKKLAENAKFLAKGGDPRPDKTSTVASKAALGKLVDYYINNGKKAIIVCAIKLLETEGDVSKKASIPYRQAIEAHRSRRAAIILKRLISNCENSRKFVRSTSPSQMALAINNYSLYSNMSAFATMESLVELPELAACAEENDIDINKQHCNSQSNDIDDIAKDSSDDETDIESYGSSIDISENSSNVKLPIPRKCLTFSFPAEKAEDNTNVEDKKLSEQPEKQVYQALADWANK